MTLFENLKDFKFDLEKLKQIIPDQPVNVVISGKMPDEMWAKAKMNKDSLYFIINNMTDYGYDKNSYQIKLLKDYAKDIEKNKSEIIDELESILSHKYGQRYIATGRIKLPKYMTTAGRNNYDINEEVATIDPIIQEKEYDMLDHSILLLIKDLKENK